MSVKIKSIALLNTNVRFQFSTTALRGVILNHRCVKSVGIFNARITVMSQFRSSGLLSQNFLIMSHRSSSRGIDTKDVNLISSYSTLPISQKEFRFPSSTLMALFSEQISRLS